MYNFSFTASNQIGFGRKAYRKSPAQRYLRYRRFIPSIRFSEGFFELLSCYFHPPSIYYRTALLSTSSAIYPYRFPFFPSHAGLKVSVTSTFTLRMQGRWHSGPQLVSVTLPLSLIIQSKYVTVNSFYLYSLQMLLLPFVTQRENNYYLDLFTRGDIS